MNAAFNRSSLPAPPPHHPPTPSSPRAASGVRGRRKRWVAPTQTGWCWQRPLKCWGMYEGVAGRPLGRLAGCPSRESLSENRLQPTACQRPMSSQEQRQADRDRLWSPCVIPSHPQPHLTPGTTFQFHGSPSKDGTHFVAILLTHLRLRKVPQSSVCILFWHEIMDLGHNSLKMSIWITSNLKRHFFPLLLLRHKRVWMSLQLLRNSVFLQELSHFSLHFTNPHKPGQNRTSISTLTKLEEQPTTPKPHLKPTAARPLMALEEPLVQIFFHVSLCSVSVGIVEIDTGLRVHSLNYWQPSKKNL